MDRDMDPELPTADHLTPSRGGERELPYKSDQMRLLKEQLAEALASKRKALIECQRTRQESTIVQRAELKRLKLDETQEDLFDLLTPQAPREVTFPRRKDDSDISSQSREAQLIGYTDEQK